MSAIQSHFSTLPKKQLFLISEQLIDNKFTTSPYIGYDYEVNYELLANVAKYFGMEVSDIDVEFFAKFIDINSHTLERIIRTKDKTSYDNLVIPTAKRYVVEYQQYGTCAYTEYLQTDWDSYDSDWVTDSMRQARDNGNWDLYDGKSIQIDYDNYDMNDYQFDDWKEIKDVKESTNKNKIIESLDKKTLLELRGLIDDRLKTL